MSEKIIHDIVASRRQCPLEKLVDINIELCEDADVEACNVVVKCNGKRVEGYGPVQRSRRVQQDYEKSGGNQLVSDSALAGQKFDERTYNEPTGPEKNFISNVQAENCDIMNLPDNVTDRITGYSSGQFFQGTENYQEKFFEDDANEQDACSRLTDCNETAENTRRVKRTSSSELAIPSSDANGNTRQLDCPSRSTETETLSIALIKSGRIENKENKFIDLFP